MDKHSLNSAVLDGKRLAYPINDLAEALGIGRTKVYAEISSGRLAAKKLGARTLVTAEAVKAYLARLPDVPVTRAA